MSSREVASAAGAAWRGLAADVKEQYEARGEQEKVGGLTVGRLACVHGYVCAGGRWRSKQQGLPVHSCLLSSCQMGR